MDRLIYKEADGDLTCRSRDFDKVFPTLYAYEETGLTPEEILKIKSERDALLDCVNGKVFAEITEIDGVPIDTVRQLLRAVYMGEVIAKDNNVPTRDEVSE